MTKHARRVRQRNPRQHDPLQLAKNRLTDAIDKLIKPRPTTTSNGNISYLPSRYDTLRDAVGSRPTSGEHSPSTRAGLPVWLDAMTLVTDIQTLVNALPIDTPNTVLRLRALEHRRWRPQDTRDILEHAAKLERFTVLIDHLFAPKPRYLPDPCPHCDATHAERIIDDQHIKTPALAITDTGATCGACGDTWPPDELPFLAAVLGYPAPPGVITNTATLPPTATDTP